jgi:dTDP-4-dehydrorhamnose reductase
MRIAVTGAGGRLGRELARALRSHDALLLDRRALDVTDPAACAAALGGADAVIHAAAWTDVDGAESAPADARATNVFGANNVAAAAPYVVVVSTDFVFDGRASAPYDEDAEPDPLQVYGETKLVGERAALLANENVAVARSAWLYGAAEPDGFVRAVLQRLEAGSPFEVVTDQVGSPTYVADLAPALVAMCEQRATGTFHVANSGEASRYDFARAIARAAGRDESLIVPVATADAPPRPAARPAYAPLRSTRHPALPPWEDALRRAMPDILGA